MTNYRRNYMAGGTYFFTVNLAERSSSLLINHVEAERVVDWPYSSFHRYVREGVLAEHWAGDSGWEDARFGERV